MLANRLTAFVDACALVGALKRNLLLTLAESGFYRIRWSAPVLDEMEVAVERLLAGRRVDRPDERARTVRAQMELAFPDAMVSGFGSVYVGCAELPDPGDAHVLAAAIKTRAVTIVTDNVRHFPTTILVPLTLDARSTDDFLSDTITLDARRAVVAVRTMRERFKRPEMTAEALLIRMEAVGLLQTVDVLRDDVLSL